MVITGFGWVVALAGRLLIDTRANQAAVRSHA
jgi:hypothetical protein